MPDRGHGPVGKDHSSVTLTCSDNRGVGRNEKSVAATTVWGDNQLSQVKGRTTMPDIPSLMSIFDKTTRT